MQKKYLEEIMNFTDVDYEIAWKEKYDSLSEETKKAVDEFGKYAETTIMNSPVHMAYHASKFVTRKFLGIIEKELETNSSFEFETGRLFPCHAKSIAKELDCDVNYKVFDNEDCSSFRVKYVFTKRDNGEQKKKYTEEQIAIMERIIKVFAYKYFPGNEWDNLLGNGNVLDSARFDALYLAKELGWTEKEMLKQIKSYPTRKLNDPLFEWVRQENKKIWDKYNNLSPIVK